MGFWDLGDGEDATEKASGGEYVSAGGGGLIPNNTNVLAIVEKAEWREAREGGNRRVSLQWRIQAPETYQNKVLFQSLWVDDLPPGNDEKKRLEKQKQHKIKLATIDFNAGGRLVAAMKKVNASRPPTDDELLFLTGRPMVIQAMLMQSRNRYGEVEKVQYVGSIMPKSHQISDGKAGYIEDTPRAGGQAQQSAGGGQGRAQGRNDVMDDDIPF